MVSTETRTKNLSEDTKNLIKCLKIGTFLGVFPTDFFDLRIQIVYKLFFIVIHLVGLTTFLFTWTNSILHLQLSTPQICLSAFSLVVFYSVNYAILGEMYFGKKSYDLFTKKLIEIDSQYTSMCYGNLPVDKKMQVLMIVFFHFAYVFQMISMILNMDSYMNDVTNCNILILASCLYFVITSYQIHHILFTIWFFCNWLKRKYGTFEETFKSLQHDDAKEKKLKAILLKQQYKSLNDVVGIFNSIFGKFILLVFLSGFMYILSSVSFSVYHSLKWKLYLEIPAAIMYCVSINDMYIYSDTT